MPRLTFLQNTPVTLSQELANELLDKLREKQDILQKLDQITAGDFSHGTRFKQIGKENGTPIYSIRINKAKRALLMYHDGQFIVLGYTDRHKEYEHLIANLKPILPDLENFIGVPYEEIQSAFETAMKEDDSEPEVSGQIAQSNEQTSLEIVSSDAHIWNGKIIELSQDQRSTIESAHTSMSHGNLPILIGPPGAGKTCIINMLAYKIATEEEKQAILIVPTADLKRAVIEQLPRLPRHVAKRIHPFSIEELLPTASHSARYATEQECITYLTQAMNKVRKPKDASKKSQAADSNIMGARKHLARYQINPDHYKQSSDIPAISRNYLALLLQHSLNDPELTPLNLSKLEAVLGLGGLVCGVDEAQNVSPVHMHNLLAWQNNKGKHQIQIVMAGDANQGGHGAGVKQDVEFSKVGTTTVEVFPLGSSHRCPIAVTRLANIVLEEMQITRQGEKNPHPDGKHGYKKIVNQNASPGQVSFESSQSDTLVTTVISRYTRSRAQYKPNDILLIVSENKVAALADTIEHFERNKQEITAPDEYPVMPSIVSNAAGLEKKCVIVIDRSLENENAPKKSFSVDWQTLYTDVTRTTETLVMIIGAGKKSLQGIKNQYVCQIENECEKSSSPKPLVPSVEEEKSSASVSKPLVQEVKANELYRQVLDYLREGLLEKARATYAAYCKKRQTEFPKNKKGLPSWEAFLAARREKKPPLGEESELLEFEKKLETEQKTDQDQSLYSERHFKILIEAVLRENSITAHVEFPIYIDTTTGSANNLNCFEQIDGQNSLTLSPFYLRRDRKSPVGRTPDPVIMIYLRSNNTISSAIMIGGYEEPARYHELLAESGARFLTGNRNFSTIKCPLQIGASPFIAALAAVGRIRPNGTLGKQRKKSASNFIQLQRESIIQEYKSPTLRRLLETQAGTAEAKAELVALRIEEIAENRKQQNFRNNSKFAIRPFEQVPEHYLSSSTEEDTLINFECIVELRARHQQVTDHRSADMQLAVIAGKLNNHDSTLTSFSQAYASNPKTLKLGLLRKIVNYMWLNHNDSLNNAIFKAGIELLHAIFKENLQRGQPAASNNAYAILLFLAEFSRYGDQESYHQSFARINNNESKTLYKLATVFAAIMDDDASLNNYKECIILLISNVAFHDWLLQDKITLFFKGSDKQKQGAPDRKKLILSLLDARGISPLVQHLITELTEEEYLTLYNQPAILEASLIFCIPHITSNHNLLQTQTSLQPEESTETAAAMLQQLTEPGIVVLAHYITLILADINQIYTYKQFTSESLRSLSDPLLRFQRWYDLRRRFLRSSLECTFMIPNNDSPHINTFENMCTVTQSPQSNLPRGIIIKFKRKRQPSPSNRHPFWHRGPEEKTPEELDPLLLPLVLINDKTEIVQQFSDLNNNPEKARQLLTACDQFNPASQCGYVAPLINRLVIAFESLVLAKKRLAIGVLSTTINLFIKVQSLNEDFFTSQLAKIFRSFLEQMHLKSNAEKMWQLIKEEEASAIPHNFNSFFSYALHQFIKSNAAAHMLDQNKIATLNCLLDCLDKVCISSGEIAVICSEECATPAELDQFERVLQSLPSDRKDINAIQAAHLKLHAIRIPPEVAPMRTLNR